QHYSFFTNIPVSSIKPMATFIYRVTINCNTECFVSSVKFKRLTFIKPPIFELVTDLIATVCVSTHHRSLLSMSGDGNLENRPDLRPSRTSCGFFNLSARGS
ncbi:hypothetical protein L9F63_013542, partial [Diploptera punctata]